MPVAVTAQRLAAAPYEVIGRFADASNATLLTRLLDVDDAPLSDDTTIDDLDPDHLAVYKPERGEAPLWDFAPGSLHRREVAAYEVSKRLGWNLVPLTVLRADGPFGVGALQRYVRHDPRDHYFHLRDAAETAVMAQLRAMVVFDLVINNADRKGGHVLYEVTDGGGHVRCIDHGVSLHVEPKVRTVAWDFALEPVPDDLRDDVRRFGNWLAGDGASVFTPLLSTVEIGAMTERAAEVAQLDTFPEPVGPRPFPWPIL